MPGQDQMKQLDAGYYGQGIYATENIFYALKYANGYNDLEVNQKAHIICCKAIYNNSKVKNLTDLSYLGKPIDSDIKSNYVINHAFVGSSTGYHPIDEKTKENNRIYANEYVFPNKFQFIPCCSLTIMHKDHYILWKDENIENSENSNYMSELSKKMEVNVYSEKSVSSAIEIIKKKKHAKVKLITNGGVNLSGKSLIEQARSIVGSNFVCLVFAGTEKHMEWVSKMENVLFTNNASDFREFASLKMNEKDILYFANKLKKRYETNEYKFKINESQLLKFPKV